MADNFQTKPVYKKDTNTDQNISADKNSFPRMKQKAMDAQ